MGLKKIIIVKNKIIHSEKPNPNINYPILNTFVKANVINNRIIRGTAMHIWLIKSGGVIIADIIKMKTII